jgi:4,5-dihydroxyphthalate decarboxylase
VFKAFSASKDLAISRLEEMSACKITMPFVDERLQKDRILMGQDFWPYGVDKNKHVLEAFFAAHHAQGISKRVITIEEMFGESMLESFRI